MRANPKSARPRVRRGTSKQRGGCFRTRNLYTVVAVVVDFTTTSSTGPIAACLALVQFHDQHILRLDVAVHNPVLV